MGTARCYNCLGSGTVNISRIDGGSTNIACPTCGGSGTLTTPDPVRVSTGGRNSGAQPSRRRSGGTLPEPVAIYIGIATVCIVWLALFYEVVLAHQANPWKPAFVIGMLIALPLTAISILRKLVLVVFIAGVAFGLVLGVLNEAWQIQLPFAAHIGLFLPVVVGIMWIMPWRIRREKSVK